MNFVLIHLSNRLLPTAYRTFETPYSCCNDGAYLDTLSVEGGVRRQEVLKGMLSSHSRQSELNPSNHHNEMTTLALNMAAACRGSHGQGSSIQSTPSLRVLIGVAIAFWFQFVVRWSEVARVRLKRRDILAASERGQNGRSWEGELLSLEGWVAKCRFGPRLRLQPCQQ